MKETKIAAMVLAVSIATFLFSIYTVMRLNHERPTVTAEIPDPSQ